MKEVEEEDGGRRGGGGGGGMMRGREGNGTHHDFKFLFSIDKISWTWSYQYMNLHIVIMMTTDHTNDFIHQARRRGDTTFDQEVLGGMVGFG